MYNTSLQEHRIFHFTTISQQSHGQQKYTSAWISELYGDDLSARKAPAKSQPLITGPQTQTHREYSAKLTCAHIQMQQNCTFHK